jgi:hypothetical protein
MRLIAYHSDHNTALFTFELAVLFIDIPEVVQCLLSVFAFPASRFPPPASRLPFALRFTSHMGCSSTM